MNIKDINFKSKVFMFGVAGVVVLFAALGGYQYVKHSKKNAINAEEDRRPMVKVTSAKIMPICRFLRLTGVLKPNNNVEIKAEVESTVAKILFKEGGNVKQGDLLIQLDDSRALANLKEAEAQYEKIKSEYIPSSELAAKGVVSKVKTETLKAELDAAEARVDACKVILAKHRITAPFSGKVSMKEVSEGQYVTNGQILTKLIDDEQLRVDFKVPDVSLAEVYQGQKLDISVDSSDKTYTAVVSAIDPVSDRFSHSFSVRAIMNEKSDEYIKPGMFVKVGVALERCKNGIVIPERAIERYGDVESVFRILSDGTAVRTNITSGYRNKGIVEVLAGLNENDTIVLEGGARVVDGRPVRILTDEMIEKLRAQYLKEQEKQKKAKEKQAKQKKK